MEAETVPGSSGNDPREESKFRTLTQQELNCSPRTSSPGGSPQGGPLPDFQPHLRSDKTTSRTHSTELKDGRDDGLDWFDFMAPSKIEPKNTVLLSPSPKATEKNMALKISNNKSQGMEKSRPGQRSKLEAGSLLSPGETDGPLRPGSVEGKKVKRRSLVSEATVPTVEPDSVLTHHVPSRLLRLRKEKAQVSSRSTTNVTSQPTDPSAGQSIPAHGLERTPEISRGKRLRSLAQEEEPELESVKIPGLPVAKLAKFTFKQKSKLIHSSEQHSHASPGTSKITVCSPKIPQHRIRREAAVSVKDPEKLTSTSGNRNFNQQQGETKELLHQPPKKDGSREEKECGPEKRVIQPELELGNKTGHSHLTCETDTKEEVSSSKKSSKVHAGTLAKLANFSFTSLLESKSESPPPPERKNWGERGPSPPPPTTDPMLRSKRKSFQLQGSAEKLILSKNSLFTLSELDDEALDFDWDEEMRKKP